MSKELSDLFKSSEITEAQNLGIGELLVTSVDRDGTRQGPESDLLKKINPEVSVPLIFGGGYNKPEEILETFKNANISAISIGSALHFNSIIIKDN